MILDRINKDIRDKSEVARTSDRDTIKVSAMPKSSPSGKDNIKVSPISKVSSSDTDTMSKGSSSYTDNITVSASDIDTTSTSLSEVSVKELPCPQCNIMFPSEQSLRSHLHYHEQYKF